MTGRPSGRNSHGILRAQAAGLMLVGVESTEGIGQDWLIQKEREGLVTQEESSIGFWLAEGNGCASVFQYDKSNVQYR